jgi:PleD family two-component response regulator
LNAPGECRSLIRETYLRGRQRGGSGRDHDLHRDLFARHRMRIAEPGDLILGRDLARNHARVLLAEDDTDVLDLTTYALRKYGYDVIGVTDGATAFERWQAEQPDMVLLDVNLPRMNGMDL